MTRFPMQRTRITLVTALLLLSACGGGTPAPDSATAGQVRVTADSVFGRLLSMNLPDGWSAVDRTERDGTVVFALPSVAAKLDDAETDRDFFVVRPLITDDCTAASIVMQAKMSHGEHPRMEDRPVELTQGGGTYGYSWFGFRGVAGGMEIPDWQFWCLSSPRFWSDIEISAKRNDESTRTFVAETFIPRWNALQNETFASPKK